MEYVKIFIRYIYRFNHLIVLYYYEYITIIHITSYYILIQVSLIHIQKNIIKKL